MSDALYIGLGILLIGYAVFDGMDLGLGAMHLILARSDEERRTNFAAIGPLWMGYEVFLVAGGGAMVAAFPRLYAASFSGFYLVLTVVLWLLIARGMSIEVRSRVTDPLWRGFWDVGFCASSALLAIFFGAAAGNVVRGVPMDANGDFIGSFGLALNPYAILIGLLSLTTLAMHGCCFIANKVEEGEYKARVTTWAKRLFWVVAPLFVVATALTGGVRSGIADNFTRYPLLAALPVIVVISLIGLFVSLRRGRLDHALPASAVLIAGMLGSAGAGLYPWLLPPLDPSRGGLTIFNASAPHENQIVSLIALVIAMTVVAAYEVLIHKAFAGPTDIDAGPH